MIYLLHELKRPHDTSPHLDASSKLVTRAQAQLLPRSIDKSETTRCNDYNNHFICKYRLTISIVMSVTSIIVTGVTCHSRWIVSHCIH